MKLSLEEARKRADELRRLAKQLRPKISNRRLWNLMKADYAYANHCRAVVPELVAALQKALYHLEAVRDVNKETTAAFKTGVAALVKAKTVEMP